LSTVMTVETDIAGQSEITLSNRVWLAGTKRPTPTLLMVSTTLVRAGSLEPNERTS
jgi:hypothetical protein